MKLIVNVDEKLFNEKIFVIADAIRTAFEHKRKDPYIAGIEIPDCIFNGFVLRVYVKENKKSYTVTVEKHDCYDKEK